MDESTSLLLSVCALLTVVGGLVLIGGFMVYRVLSRGGLLQGLMGAIGGLVGDDEEDESGLPLTTRSRRVDPQALADQVDFDAALARQKSDDTAFDISAQQASSGQQSPRPGTSGPKRVLRSGHEDSDPAPTNKPARTPGREKDQDFETQWG